MERTGTATAAAARYNLVPYCRALTAERPSQPLCHAHSVPTGWLGLTSSASTPPKTYRSRIRFSGPFEFLLRRKKFELGIGKRNLGFSEARCKGLT